MEVTDQELVNRFMGGAGPNTPPPVANVRIAYTELAKRVRDITPAGREQALALTNLEQSMLWAEHALANDQVYQPGNV